MTLIIPLLIIQQPSRSTQNWLIIQILKNWHIKLLNERASSCWLRNYTKTENLVLNYPTKQKVADDLALYTNTETLTNKLCNQVQVDTKLQDYTKTEDLVLNYATKEDVGQT